MHIFDYTRMLPLSKRRLSRRTMFYCALSVLGTIAISLFLISCYFPWVWYGSRTAYGIHQFGSKDAYVRSCRLSYEQSPSLVIYEEDSKSAQMLVESDPNHYFKSRMGGAGHEPSGQIMVAPGGLFDAVAFLHERQVAGCKPRLVEVFITQGYEDRTHPTSGKSPIQLVFRSEQPHGDPPMLFKPQGMRVFELPIAAGKYRLFAGQTDPTDTTHFTIGYELNDRPGTIDGWLKADDSVKILIRGRS